MNDNRTESYIRKFLNSEFGKLFTSFGVIAGTTFGISIVMLFVSYLLQLQSPYDMIFGIVSLLWIPTGLVLLIIKGEDLIMKKIYPDWDLDEEMIEAFRSQA